ncbi:MAG: hypothetical protein EON90_11795 [Brevundimonas sp.]|nr:MAG: hypothetical protein EON90_11795 [Brevundimonas sp.]
MTAIKTAASLAAGALLLSAGSALAQTPYGSSSTQNPTQQDTVGAIIGALFGDRLGVSTSIESQWAAGRKPLATQRTQFNAQIDTGVRNGSLTSANGARMKSEYDALVALETRYGADGRFTTAERTELGDRYGDLTQALTDGGYADTGGSTGGSATLTVATGRTEFERRVDAAVSSRRITRTEGTRLKTDYAALIQTETTYARDGISSRERDDLDARLDALDARVGDTAYGGGSAVLTPAARLDAIARALPSSGLSASAQTQLRVEHGDLTRLEAAYSRYSASSDDRAYLEGRIADLETRARVRR